MVDPRPVVSARGRFGPRRVTTVRPDGERHDEAIMECMFLAPYQGERPSAAPIHWLGTDDDWTEAPELGLLAREFNQGVFNLPKVHLGLAGSDIDQVTFADYQETKLRHFHALLGEWIAAR